MHVIMHKRTHICKHKPEQEILKRVMIYINFSKKQLKASG